MKERGISMADWCVRAMLDGQKTQTRRVITQFNKRWPYAQWTEILPHPSGGFWAHDATPGWRPPDHDAPTFTSLGKTYENKGRPAPYAVGDHLWVRESLRAFRKNDGKVVADYAATHTPVLYVAGAREGWYGQAVWQWQRKTLPSRFMPKWAARIWREVTAVRAERVQDISEDDAEAEGVYRYWTHCCDTGIWSSEWDEDEGKSSRGLFELAWDSINFSRGYGWDANPWVWVYDFKPLEAPK